MFNYPPDSTRLLSSLKTWRMNNCIFFLGLLLISLPVPAQLKTSPVCPPFSIDILDGTINELTPASTTGEVKKKFPCFTDADESSSACGGLVSYRDKDIYFYTGRSYVEIREKFKGSLSLPLFGAARNSLFKWLGNPHIRDVNWDAYSTAYGTLILYFSPSGKVNKIRFGTRTPESMKLCE